MPVGKYKENASAYARAVRAAKPVDPKKSVRMPFDRSAAERRCILQRGSMEVAPNMLESCPPRPGASRRTARPALTPRMNEDSIPISGSPPLAFRRLSAGGDGAAAGDIGGCGGAPGGAASPR